MHLGRFVIAQQSVVATHVVVIDRLLQESDRSVEEQPFRLGCFSQFVQAETGVQKSGAALRRDSAELAASPQRLRPFLRTHQVMKPHLQDFRAMLKCALNCVQLGHRLPGHAQLGITASGPKSPFETHASVLSKELAKHAKRKVDLVATRLWRVKTARRAVATAANLPVRSTFARTNPASLRLAPMWSCRRRRL